MTVVDPRMSDEGLVLRGDGGEDPLFHAPLPSDVYLQADPRYTGRVTLSPCSGTKKRRSSATGHAT